MEGTASSSNVMESKDGTSSSDLPLHASLYSLQVAGHVHGKGKTKLGLLKHENGNILKPLIKGDIRSTRELTFYENVFENCQSDSLFSELKSFIPKFHGTWEAKIADKVIQYLCLEDVCEHFQKSSALDVKIGVRTYDPEASAEKFKAEINKYPAGKSLGFRILGMKVYNECKQSYMCKDKDYGKKFTPETIVFALDQYLNNNLGRINCLILCGFIHSLLRLADWFSEQRIFAFYSSSLLFVYESMKSSWTSWIQKTVCSDISISEPCNTTVCPYCNHSLDFNMCDSHFLSCHLFPDINSETLCPVCGLNRNICLQVQTNCSLYRTVMIDFAHTFQTSKEDSNYIFGLTVLLEKLKDLLKLHREKYSSL